MSISLNNHESRITALENGLSYYETVIWSGDVNWDVHDGDLITVAKPFKDFHMIAVKGYYSNGMYFRLINVRQLLTAPLAGKYNTLMHDPEIKWMPFTQVDDYRLRIYSSHATTTQINITEIIGVRFAKVILYNFSYIIKSAQKFTPLSHLFNKEV